MITPVPFPCELEESSMQISHTFFSSTTDAASFVYHRIPSLQNHWKICLKNQQWLEFQWFRAGVLVYPDALKFFEFITIGESPCTFSNCCAFKTF